MSNRPTDPIDDGMTPLPPNTPPAACCLAPALVLALALGVFAYGAISSLLK